MSTGNLLFGELLGHRIVVLGGPRMSGKTNALLDLEKTLADRNVPYAVFRATISPFDRAESVIDDPDKIVSHNGRESIQPVVPITRLVEAWTYPGIDFCLISDISFLSLEGVEVDILHVPRNRYIFAEGLDRCWIDGSRNIAWSDVAQAGRVLNLVGVCDFCRGPATHTLCLCQHSGPCFKLREPEMYRQVCFSCFNANKMREKDGKVQKNRRSRKKSTNSRLAVR